MFERLAAVIIIHLQLHNHRPATSAHYCGLVILNSILPTYISDYSLQLDAVHITDYESHELRGFRIYLWQRTAPIRPVITSISDNGQKNNGNNHKAHNYIFDYSSFRIVIV